MAGLACERAYIYNYEIHIIAVAKSFLHHQIRNFAGTLHLVGTGKWDNARVQAALDAKDRQMGGPTAPSIS